METLEGITSVFLDSMVFLGFFFGEKMDNSDGKRHILLHCCHVVWDWDEGYTTKTKNMGEKPPNPAIFLDSASLLEVFSGENRKFHWKRPHFFCGSRQG